jgi:hypothetical protein
MAVYHEDFQYDSEAELEAGGWNVDVNTGWESVIYTTGPQFFGDGSGYVKVQTPLDTSGAMFKMSRPLALSNITSFYAHLIDGNFPSGPGLPLTTATLTTMFGLSVGDQYLYARIRESREVDTEGDFGPAERYFSIAQSNGTTVTNSGEVNFDVSDPDYVRLLITGSTVKLQVNDSVNTLPGSIWSDFVGPVALVGGPGTFDTFDVIMEANSRQNFFQELEVWSVHIEGTESGGSRPYYTPGISGAFNSVKTQFKPR